MLLNYLKIASRNVRKNKVHSVINIAGLAVGVACFLMIALFVVDELTYDSFNTNADRIFRVNVSYNIGGNAFKMANSPAPLGGVLVSEYPEIKKTVRIIETNNTYVKKGEVFIKEGKFFYADSSLFEIFTINFVQGSRTAALEKPNCVVITTKTAEKYFNSINPVGQSLVLSDGKEFIITGVVQPLPDNSQFDFDFIASYSTLPQSRETSWFGAYAHTYVLTNTGVTAEVLNSKIFSVAEKYLSPITKAAFGMGYKEFIDKGNDYSFEFVPLKEIHLYSNVYNEFKETGSIDTVYLFSAVAIFILIIACINFINLSTAKSSKRAGEIGMRKILGSGKFLLIKQLLTESILLCFIAVVCSVILVELTVPLFNHLTDKHLSLNLFGNYFTVPLLLLFSIVLGIAAGLYPALLLVSAKPVLSLKSKTSGSKTSRWLRNGLVVFQFATSIILFVGTLVIYRQMEYVKNKNLGLNQDHVLIIKNIKDLGREQFAFTNSVKENSNVLDVSLSEGLPDHSLSANIFRKEGGSEENQTLVVLRADYNFLNTYKIKMREGRFFDRQISTDSSAIVLNEAAIKKLNLDDPLNSKLLFNLGESDNIAKLPIIGITKDFHLQSLKDEIRPAAIVLLNKPEAEFLSVKISSANIDGTIQYLSEKWKEFGQLKPMEYSFFDESFDDMYRSEIQSEKVFTIFAVLAIMIACLGLFGLAAFIAEQRTKEIGIRKVLGASVPTILYMLSKDFAKWVILANIIAWPVAWYAMNNWLQKFVYRIDISWWIFALSGIIALAIALATVSFQAIKAATANPVESLRYE